MAFINIHILYFHTMLHAFNEVSEIMELWRGILGEFWKVEWNQSTKGVDQQVKVFRFIGFTFPLILVK